MSIMSDVSAAAQAAVHATDATAAETRFVLGTGVRTPRLTELRRQVAWKLYREGFTLDEIATAVAVWGDHRAVRKALDAAA